MPTTQQLRSRLTTKLKELFQLDQPDLDFGFYRIMHAKAQHVSEFIENDLLTIVTDAFGHLEAQNSQGSLTQAKQQVIDTIGGEAFDAQGNLNPAYKNLPVGKRYLAELAKIEQNKQALSAEADIYDHLYRFFERYYDSGDFISRRYYTRETAGKAAPFAVPYNGEEVKLHWANADQYYIKTTEYFANFTFDLRQAAEVQATRLPMGFEESEQPRKVHFRIVDASEGEHGNVKASEATKRFFLIYTAKPVEMNPAGELVVNFEYRADTEKNGQDNTWRDKRNGEAVVKVLAQLRTLAQGDKNAAEYLRLLETPAPTESDKQRPLLAKYINQYTARNTMDYFIHKDLAGFLRRELDFYIKNEVMRLDDIENADAPAVESYLAKIKVLRKIAGKLIDFLVQLEEFQKKLWLKKKFVVETNYCITLDRVPEELYPEIAANERQREEWVKLFAIDEITLSTVTPSYSVPLTVEFLQANDKLVLDTRYFCETFTVKLIAAIENLDEQCDGLLIHSENFQALRLIEGRFRNQIKCIYIDPPFNLKKDGDFLYRTDYKDSTWIALLANTMATACSLLDTSAFFFLRCDHNGNFLARSLLDCYFGKEGFLSELLVQRIRKNVTGQGKISLPLANDSLFFYTNTENYTLCNPYLELEKTRESYWRRIDDSAGHRNPPERTIFGKVFSPYKYDAHFKFSQKTIDKMIREGKIRLECKNCKHPFTEGTWKHCIQCGSDEAIPKYLVPETNQKILDTNWMDVSGYSSTTGFSTENSESLLNRVLDVASEDGDLILDYFGGSGTTINVAAKKGRKWIGIEMGNQFDEYIVKRLKITSASEGNLFKTLRLESYEDTLNNLIFAENPTRQRIIDSNTSLKEDFMLHYLLDVETRGSQSLLNIDRFADPTAYTLQVKKPGSDEYVVKNVDLLETFNYLIGLRVTHIAAPQQFTAQFKRLPDPELPHDQQTKLSIDGRLTQIQNPKSEIENPTWWFRKVEGWLPSDPANPNNGQRQKVLIVWRKLTGDLEKDNLMLDEWFKKNRISTLDFEFQTIYVNGSNNLPNLALDNETWKVRLIEEEFMQRMWDGE